MNSHTRINVGFERVDQKFRFIKMVARFSRELNMGRMVNPVLAQILATSTMTQENLCLPVATTSCSTWHRVVAVDIALDRRRPTWMRSDSYWSALGSLLQGRSGRGEFPRGDAPVVKFIQLYEKRTTDLSSYSRCHYDRGSAYLGITPSTVLGNKEVDQY